MLQTIIKRQFFVKCESEKLYKLGLSTTLREAVFVYLHVRHWGTLHYRLYQKYSSWMIAWWLLDDRLMIVCNIYNFSFFFKKTFLTMWGDILLWIFVYSHVRHWGTLHHHNHYQIIIKPLETIELYLLDWFVFVFYIALQ